MANNVTLPATGSGSATPIVATEEIGGAQHQLVKIEFGAAGVATKVESSAPLPVTDALGATASAQATGNASLSSIDGKLPNLGQALEAASIPAVLPQSQIDALTPPAAITGFSTSALQGALTETAPATDTASSGQNGRLQRIAQRITSLIALLPTSLAAGGGLKVEGVEGGVSIPTTSTPAKVSSANNSGSQVTLSTTVATLLDSFSTRSGVYILADVDMFVKFGTGATTAAFRLEAGQPMNLTGCTYTGVITAILSTGTGTAYVMEW